MIKVRITSKAGRTLKTDLPANIHALHHTLTEISFSHLQNMTQTGVATYPDGLLF